jgi:hypothetical protein
MIVCTPQGPDRHGSRVKITRPDGPIVISDAADTKSFDIWNDCFATPTGRFLHRCASLEPNHQKIGSSWFRFSMPD